MGNKRMARTAALLLLFFCTGARTEAGDGLDEKLPSLEGLVSYGCLVQGPITRIDHADARGRTQTVWLVTLWAEHQTSHSTKPIRDWKLAYSFRKKRSKSLTDCNRFMQRVMKAALGREADRPRQLAARR